MSQNKSSQILKNDIIKNMFPDQTEIKIDTISNKREISKHLDSL